MTSLEWFIVAALAPIVAMGLMLVPRMHVVVPWLGLLVVLIGTLPAFSASVTIIERGGIGVGVGWFVTVFYSLIGLAFVFWGTLKDDFPFIPTAMLVTGVTYIASFFGYFPEWWGKDQSVGLVIGLFAMMAPGLALISLSVLRWKRYGSVRGTTGAR
ncbi:MAG: hypothetical protein WD533_02895 [Dehalococcoidia bacterium]